MQAKPMHPYMHVKGKCPGNHDQCFSVQDGFRATT